MTPGEEPAIAGEPYQWDQSVQLPPDVIHLFQQVAHGLEKSQTVIWKNSVASLEAVHRYLDSSKEARTFMEKYMRNIISILLEQHPHKCSVFERNCVEESFECAVSIIAKDIRIQLKRNGDSEVLDVLAMVFNRKKCYYKSTKNSWSAHLNGLPEVRMRVVEKFQLEQGFAALAEYLSRRVKDSLKFPPLDVMHEVIVALTDAVPVYSAAVERKIGTQELENDAILVANTVIERIASCSDDELKKMHLELLHPIRSDLQRLFERMTVTRRKEMYAFYEFWRALTLKLLTSQSLPLKLFGWDQVNDLIAASTSHRPPPRKMVVSGAGATLANGDYEYNAALTPDGYAMPHVEVTFVRTIPETEKDGGGKKLTLFRCTMRSQQKWWFLSEADEEQPGTDRDIDYYQQKTKSQGEREPPSDNWSTCKNAGIEPPPTLRAEGSVVPPGEEYNTLEHQLARWAIENGIVELVLGDSLHREIVARSTNLITFLASMCERDKAVGGFEGILKPNTYCLQDSHLLLAWKTCTSKADAAVSTEIFQVLVSILPSLSSGMAVTLLSNVQMSLRGSTEKRDYLPEVAEFCSILASSTPVDNKTGQVLGLQGVSDEVRKEILHLMWSLLTHPDASSLKNYDNLKRYVANELRLEPTGAASRHDFLNSCTKRLAENTARAPGNGVVDELHVLRTVKLTQFVLQACPRDQTIMFVTERDGALPLLLFNELIAYMGRRNSDLTMSPAQKRTGAGEVKHDVVSALSERLQILRYVYGVSDEVKLSSAQLRQLWQLCSIPSDQESLMIFIASASGSEPTARASGTVLVEPHPMHAQSNKAHQTVAHETLVTAAFADDVRTSAFLDLFCSTFVNWGDLGEGAYSSFQSMFKKLRQSPEAAMATSAPSLDALWRICLNAGNDSVASQAMTDLLAVYSAMASATQTQNAWADERMSPTGSDSMTIDTGDESFGNRVFQCLVEVKKGLEAGTLSSERSAERCLRILNAAVSHDGSNGQSVASSALNAVYSVSSSASLSSALASLPHGMRGQSCYRRIGIMAKRTNPNTHNVPGSVAITSPDGREGVTNSGSKSSNFRFTLYVHPLETLASIKEKVAAYCDCPVAFVKPISVSGRLVDAGNRTQGNDPSQLSLAVAAEDSIVDQLGIVHGCEVVVVIADRQTSIPHTVSSAKRSTDSVSALNVSEIFTGAGEFADRLFETLLGVLELLPWRQTEGNSLQAVDSHKLVWDLLLAMPTNRGIIDRVQNASRAERPVDGDNDSMVLDSPNERYSDLLDRSSFHHSVYVMQVIESFLQPAPEALSILSPETRKQFKTALTQDAASFRLAFIQSGGFDAVARWFSTPGNDKSQKLSERRMGNAVALRILKCCLFGCSPSVVSPETLSAQSLDEAGTQLLRSWSGSRGLQTSLAAMVVRDDGIASATILDVLRFLWLLFGSLHSTEVFVSLPDNLAERFLVTLLLWEGRPESARTSAMFGNASRIREDTHNLVLKTPLLAKHALPWLISALDDIEVSSDATTEYFGVLRQLVDVGSNPPNKASVMYASGADLQALGTAVCKKLLSCPRPTNDSALVDFSTGVLCGCLSLLKAVIVVGGSHALKTGTNILLDDLEIARWSSANRPPSTGVLQRVSSFRSRPRPDEATMIDLAGALFEGFLSPGGSSSVVAICCDKESRWLGFDAVATAARSCQGHNGYAALVQRISGIVETAVPRLRHRWNQNGGGNDGHSRSLRNTATAKYSGLRNQGCTCYMNSFLQQMFMMPELRRVMCAAPLPASLRTSGGTFAKGAELVGKKISVQWDNGISYDALVEGFDDATGMHRIRYCPMQVATVGGGPHGHHNQVTPEDVAKMPPELPEEFFISEGRPGRETGVFEIVDMERSPGAGEGTSERSDSREDDGQQVNETEDESSSRHLLEEVQRTFIHLDEGSRGRCFDPRALVEACACLKLEFDVWQQNDASEFAMKLLDRMEIALKKWAPEQFRYLDHTFGLKQTKQKVCKECGLKTNREENLMNIDCQIRGKTDIHEALSTMCEVELMEGNNKVFCDRCKKNTDTVLKTAISALPDMLILSLKRFDLDYTTFETVKLNSRCEFGQTLNMKRYTLEGVEALERADIESEDAEASRMETDEDDADDVQVDPLSSLPDEDYEYGLVGVLVHAGVAQGGHYYSFIKDRTPGVDADKWYRFDDEDVTAFDPSSIEEECFGGVISKDPKWPNGTVQTQERYANALMLFYEKVKPARKPEEVEKETEKVVDARVVKTTGYDVFTPDVRQSNATHRWQTFLFDAQFQLFLQGLLGLCRESSTNMNLVDTSLQMTDSSWMNSILDMLISFFFDVLFYSSDRGAVNTWVVMLSDIFRNDGKAAKRFVRLLAERTLTVSSNWLRTYLSDCPEHDARVAAVRVFTAGIQACANYPDEQDSLRKWSSAWRAQVKANSPGQALPMQLGDSLAGYESLTSSDGSRIGRILSYLTCLLEVAPRTWRYNAELCLFVRDLSNAGSGQGGRCLREAMRSAEFPARLICLVCRERVPPSLRSAFPGASVSFQAAESQARPETNPSAQLMPIGSGQMVGAHDRSSRHAVPVHHPSSADYRTLFEAFACLVGVKGVAHAPLIVESNETPQSFVLSRKAEDAFSTVFEESCSSPTVGMTHREIERYMHRCGVDSTSLSPQAVTETLSKYSSSTEGSGSKVISVLTRDGFLAYYRDIAQSEDSRVRKELHRFGYRPDLSRRSFESIYKTSGDGRKPRQCVESVAMDVAELEESRSGRDHPHLSRLCRAGLECFHFFAHAFHASQPMAEHILVTCTYGREDEIDRLIINSLRSLYRSSPVWQGKETWDAAIMILKTLVAVPDKYQTNRISLIMEGDQNNYPNSEYALGLVEAPKTLNRSTQHYSQEVTYQYRGYAEIVKRLANFEPVFRWLEENRDKWAHMEREIVSREDVSSRQQPTRMNYSRRDDENMSAMIDTHGHSDSDMPCTNESDEDEEDDEYDSNFFSDQFECVVVEGAGLDVVNGVYQRIGIFDSVGRYGRIGVWKDQQHEFSLFRCNTSNNTKHWYISIVPQGVQPGTSTDIDFYSAPISENDPDYPPVAGWSRSSEGKDPVPSVTLQQPNSHLGELEHPGIRWEDNRGGRNRHYV